MWHPVDKDQNEQLDDLLKCVGVEAGHSQCLDPGVRYKRVLIIALRAIFVSVMLILQLLLSHLGL